MTFARDSDNTLEARLLILVSAREPAVASAPDRRDNGGATDAVATDSTAARVRQTPAPNRASILALCEQNAGHLTQFGEIAAHQIKRRAAFEWRCMIWTTQPSGRAIVEGKDTQRRIN